MKIEEHKDLKGERGKSKQRKGGREKAGFRKGRKH